MTMTKQDFVKLAGACEPLAPSVAVDIAIDAIVECCKGSNERFNEKLFRKACGQRLTDSGGWTKFP